MFFCKLNQIHISIYSDLKYLFVLYFRPMFGDELVIVDLRLKHLRNQSPLLFSSQLFLFNKFLGLRGSCLVLNVIN